MSKKRTAKITSPLEPDYPHATYRIMCPVCGTNLWADNDPPPVEGEEILAGHTCQGRDTQLDVTPDTPTPLQTQPRTAEQAAEEPVVAGFSTQEHPGSGVPRGTPPPPPKK